MNKLSSLLFVGILSVIGFRATAQSPTVMPSSPEASALSKSINFPVSYNTGVPDIKVPLYEIKTASGLTVPVSLSYHAGGFRINEKSTSVGLGWTLSTSLQVSRSVAGADDLQSTIGYYYRTYIDWQNPPSRTVEYNFRLLRGEADEQPDAFNYRLLNKSGTFYFYKSQGQPTRAVSVPYTGVKIELMGNNNIGSDQHCFKITDTDGTVYWFGRNADNPSSQVAVEWTSSAPFGSSNFNSEISAWKCINIISPNKADVIQFEYIDKGTQFIYTHQDRIELHESTQCWGSSSGYCPPVGGMPVNTNAGAYLYGPYTPLCYSLGIYYPMAGGTPNWNSQYSPSPLLTDSVSFFRMSTPRYFNYSTGSDVGLYVPWMKPDGLGSYSQENTKYEINEGGMNSNNGIMENNVSAQDLQLSRITFPGGKLDFNIVGGDVINGYQQSISRLASIDVFNNVDLSPIKNIAFYQSEPFGCTGSTPYLQKLISPTRYLDSVKVSKNGTAERYAFEYRDKYCFNNLKGSDSWGGVNASTTSRSQTSSVPASVMQSTHYTDNLCANQTTIQYTIGDGSKLVDTGLVKSGIITKMIYPGGGSTAFEFGSNRYKDQNNVLQLAGGLRIEKIRYYDGVNSQAAFEKIYKYGKGEDQAGIIFSAPSMETIGYGGYKYSQNIYYGMYSGSSPTYTWSGLTTETRTTYTTDSFLDLFYASGAPVHYLEVSEYQSDLGTITGKTVYDYGEDPYFGYGASYIYTGTNLVGKPTTWDVGKLESESYLKYTGSSYDTVRKKTYSYYKLDKEKIHAGQVFQSNLYRGVYYSGFGPLPTIAEYTEVPDEVYQVSDFIPFNYQITSGTMLLTKEKEEWREPSGVLNKTTEYQYGDELQVKEVTVSQSDGRKLVTNTTYAGDYTSGTAFTDNLKANYMLAVPVETTTAIDDGSTQKIISGQLTTYFSDNTGLPEKSYQLETDTPLSSFQPSTTSGFNPDTHYKEKIAYGYDTSKGLVTVTPKDNMTISYVWGYGGQYPVAEIKNADYNTVVSVLGGSTAVSNFRNNLTPSDNDVNTFLSSLRSTFPEAMVTTFTYIPLVGMSSQTDPKGMIMTYEYDGFQRLKHIKDNDGNIVKNYDYHYAGGVCTPISGSPGIYARVELDNSNTMYDDWSSPDGMYAYTTADLYVRFYADEACTTPYTLTANMDLTVRTGATYINLPYQDSSSDDVYTASASTSALYLGNWVLTDEFISYYGSPPSSSANYTYEVVEHNPNNYNPLPTY